MNVLFSTDPILAFEVRMIFMKYSSHSVNALSLGDIDKLENSILELEKNSIAKEMIIQIFIGLKVVPWKFLGTFGSEIV